MEVTRTSQVFDPDVKRMPLPFMLKSKCPKCGRECERDLEKSYPEYPVFGAPTDVYFYCGECDEDWAEEIKIDIQVTSIH